MLKWKKIHLGLFTDFHVTHHSWELGRRHVRVRQSDEVEAQIQWLISSARQRLAKGCLVLAEGTWFNEHGVLSELSSVVDSVTGETLEVLRVMSPQLEAAWSTASARLIMVLQTEPQHQTSIWERVNTAAVEEAPGRDAYVGSLQRMSSFDKEILRLSQWVLGKFPRGVGHMLEEEELGQLGVLEHQADSPREFGLKAKWRLESMKSFVRQDCSARLARARLRQLGPINMEFKAGDLIMYRKADEPRRHGPGRIIGF